MPIPIERSERAVTTAAALVTVEVFESFLQCQTKSKSQLHMEDREWVDMVSMVRRLPLNGPGDALIFDRNAAVRLTSTDWKLRPVTGHSPGCRQGSVRSGESSSPASRFGQVHVAAKPIRLASRDAACAALSSRSKDVATARSCFGANDW